jgi:hypothetical protein
VFPQLAHTLSLAVFYSVQAAILFASFNLKNDAKMRLIVMMVILPTILIGVIDGRWVNAVALLFLFLSHFIVYVRILDENPDDPNRPPAGTGADYVPGWARHTTNPNEILNRLGPAAGKIGGSTLGTKMLAPDRSGVGRHRRALTIA